jgi:transcriptional regulator with XRE-family HTH domain
MPSSTLPIDDYYADQNEKDQGVASQLVRQLSDPQPADRLVIDQLSSYRRLRRRWSDWDALVRDTFSGIEDFGSPSSLVKSLRLGAGLSQRALARRAGTSQPAIARYERGAATPSWETLQRLAAACGRWVRIESGVVPDPDDVELAATLLRMTPAERLRSLGRYARLRKLAGEQA